MDGIVVVGSEIGSMIVRFLFLSDLTITVVYWDLDPGVRYTQ